MIQLRYCCWLLVLTSIFSMTYGQTATSTPTPPAKPSNTSLGQEDRTLIAGQNVKLYYLREATKIVGC